MVLEQHSPGRSTHCPVQYWGASEALSWNHLVRRYGAGPCTRVSSTYLDPADTEHVFTEGSMGWGAAGRRGLRDAQLAALLPGSGEGKQCSRYQTPPAPEGKRVRVQGGGQDPGTDGQALTHWWGGLRPPTEGSWNSIGQSCGSRRSSAQAFAERQCRLVAGGAHTRLLRDGPAHHPECS